MFADVKPVQEDHYLITDKHLYENVDCSFYQWIYFSKEKKRMSPNLFLFSPLAFANLINAHTLTNTRPESLMN